MIIVKNASKAHPSEKWIALAMGEIDPYGNPFQLIELSWNKGLRLRRAAEYLKTRGDIDDTIITADTTNGGIEIRYRQNGSVMWVQKEGIGPYTGQLARTPKNIAFLVANYKDGDWTIKSPLTVENEVRVLWEKWFNSLTESQQKAENDRIKSKHTHYQARKDEPYMAPPADKVVEGERAKSLTLKEIELKERELALEKREKALLVKDEERLIAGGSVTTYSREFLQAKTFHELKAFAKEIGIPHLRPDSADVLINRILESQKPAVSTEPEKVTG